MSINKCGAAAPSSDNFQKVVALAAALQRECGETLSTATVAPSSKVAKSDVFTWSFNSSTCSRHGGRNMLLKQRRSLCSSADDLGLPLKCSKAFLVPASPCRALGTTTAASICFPIGLIIKISAESNTEAAGTAPRHMFSVGRNPVKRHPQSVSTNVGLHAHYVHSQCIQTAIRWPLQCL